MHLLDTRGQAWLARTLCEDPLMLLILCLATISCLFIFTFAVLCSTAVVLQFLKQYQHALRLYELTLNIRRNLPFAGSTARTDVWHISLANCYRAQGKYADAEQLYTTVLNTDKRSSVLDRITNYGLKDVARENYVALLEETGRHSEAHEVRQEIGKSATLIRLKYLAVSSVVLCFGVGFAFFENAMLNDLIH